MPNRWVREDAIESEPVNSVSWQAEVFWRRLLNRADDFGRYSANLKLLRTQVFPLQIDRVAEMDVARLLSDCEKAGLLFVYKASDGKPYLVLNKWEKGRAKKSKYPDPPPEVCERMQTFVYECEHLQTNAPASDPGFRSRLPTSDTERESTHAREAVEIPKSVEEVQAYGLMQAVKPEVCLKFWDDMEASGWIDRNGRIWSDWRAKLRSYATTWRGNETKFGTNGHATGSKPRSVYDLSKIIESKERIVKELEVRYATEAPTGEMEWSDRQKKEMWKAEKKLIRELNEERSKHGNLKPA